jgi:hypothetical protein
VKKELEVAWSSRQTHHSRLRSMHGPPVGTARVDGRRRPQVAGGRRRQGRRDRRPGVQRAAALRRARGDRRARTRALLAPGVRPPHRTFPRHVSSSCSILPLSLTLCVLGPDEPWNRFLVWLCLQDAEGNWHTGAIAAAADDVCVAAIMSVEGIIKVSVNFDVSYFSPAKLHVRTIPPISFYFSPGSQTNKGSTFPSVFCSAV